MESGNEYILQVKGNQPSLLSAIKETICKQGPVDQDYTLEKNRGRIENREAYVYQNLQNSVFNEWCGCRTIIHIHSYGIRDNKKYDDSRYYISSLVIDQAKYYNAGIRSHWSIENSLHWVKDVIMKEDKGLVKGMKQSEVLSTFRSIVISLFRMNKYKSIKNAHERFANRLVKSIQLIENNHILNNMK